MYYLLNVASFYLTFISIAVTYEKSAPAWVLLLFIIAAACFQFVASAWIVKKFDDLETRIEKLENEKEDKSK